MAELLARYGDFANEELLKSLSAYLELLLRWNERTNLTAIRDPEEIIERHFGESLFAGLHLPACTTLLDFGSGAGFPGLPIQLLKPELRVTLAESQHKKSAFLREAVRVLGLKTEIWAARVEEMPTERCFEVVALRAVDRPEVALRLSRARVAPGGHLLELTTGIERDRAIKVPGTADGVLLITAIDVSRGTC